MTDHSVKCPTAITSKCAEGVFYDDTITELGCLNVQCAIEALGALPSVGPQGAQGDAGAQGAQGPGSATTLDFGTFTTSVVTQDESLPALGWVKLPGPNDITVWWSRVGNIVNGSAQLRDAEWAAGAHSFTLSFSVPFTISNNQLAGTCTWSGPGNATTTGWTVDDNNFTNIRVKGTIQHLEGGTTVTGYVSFACEVFDP